MCKTGSVISTSATTTSCTFTHKSYATATNYFKVAKSYCATANTFASKYTKLDAAIDACNKAGSAKCNGINDEECDEKGPFALCKTGTSVVVAASTTGSCVFRHKSYTADQKHKTAHAQYTKLARSYCPSKNRLSKTTYTTLAKAVAACDKAGSASCHAISLAKCDAKSGYHTC